MTKNEINMCIELSKYLADNARLIQPRIERVINETSQNVYSYKYGIGGQNLHRGWYCPSIIYDIVIGNASRGRIVKNYRSQTLPSYRYCFDANGNLSCVDEYYNGMIAGKEYLLRDDRTIEGFTVAPSNELMRYCEERYSNSFLSQYSYINYNPCDKTPYFLHSEKYKLEGNRLICWFAEFEIITKSGWSHNFIFSLAEQGIIQSYYIENEDKNVADNQIFLVSKKRNILTN